MHRAIRRSAPQMSARGRRAWRSPSGPRRSAPRFAWLETPRAAVAVLGYATPPRGFVASLRTRRGAVHPIRATGQRVTDDQRACLAERAPEFRRRWSTAHGEEIGRLHGQPFAPLRPPALEHLPPALRLHALAEAVRLGSPPTIRLKRALHVGNSPSES